MIERERRFLVRSLPDALPPGSRIEQGYLLARSQFSIRIRRRDDTCSLTIKGGTGRERTEIERPLSSEEFDALWPETAGRRVEKTRHVIPLADGEKAELDLFQGDLEGLRMVEVEFASAARADRFRLPDWFGDEVTEDGRFTNAALALHGLPG